MPDHLAVEHRVRAFIADHHAWEERWGRRQSAAAGSLNGGSLADRLATLEEGSSWLDAAREELLNLGRRHGTEGDFLTAGGFSVSHPPRHHPERERVETMHVGGDAGEATVETEVVGEDGRPVHGFEYLLRRSAEGDWRIVAVDEFLHPRTAASTTSGVGSEHLPTRLPLTGDVRLDFARAFRDGASVAIRGEPTRVALVRAGRLGLPSGAVVVHDPGTLAWEHPLRPLDLRLPAGVDGGWELLLSTAEGLVGAVMLRRLEGETEATVAFVPATLAGAGPAPYHVSVDGGVVCLADAGRLAALGARDCARLDRRLTRVMLPAGGPYRDFVLAHSLQGNPAGDNDEALPDVAVVRTGMGDGGYPCYWGLDAAGVPLCLVVDFLVYGHHREREIVVALDPALLVTGGELADPALVAAGFDLHLARLEPATLAVTERGGRDFDVELLDGAGQELAHPGGCRVGAEGRTDYLTGVPTDAPATHLRVRWREWEHDLRC